MEIQDLPRIARTARFLKICIVLFPLWGASGCAIATRERQTSNPVTMVDELEARNQAIKIALTDDFHFTGSIVPIRNVQAEIMTFQTAMRDLQGKQMSCGYDTTRDVSGLFWVVTMDGDWPQSFPPLPTPEPTWISWYSLAVVSNATTGETFCIGARN